MRTDYEDWVRQLGFVLYLTERCNYNCSHCLLAGNRPDLDSEVAKAFLDEIAAWELVGIDAIQLAGGEVVLHPDFHSICVYVKDRGFVPTFISNGKSVVDCDPGWLREIRPDVTLSLDGDPEFHDLLRNVRGAFDTVQRSVEALHSSDCQVSIICSLCKRNLPLVDYVVAFCVENRVREVRFQPIVPLGRATKSFKENEFLDQSDLTDLLFRVEDLREHHAGNLSIEFNIFFDETSRKHPCQFLTGHCYGKGCAKRKSTGPDTVVLCGDGLLLPDYGSANEKYAIGSLLHGSLGECLAAYYGSTSHERYRSILTYAFVKEVVHRKEQVFTYDFERYITDYTNLPWETVENFVCDKWV